VIIVDPWLINNPKTPPRYKDLDAVGGIDVILVTHARGDWLGAHRATTQGACFLLKPWSRRLIEGLLASPRMDCGPVGCPSWQTDGHSEGLGGACRRSVEGSTGRCASAAPEAARVPIGGKSQC
jgi:hypothetical protein